MRARDRAEALAAKLRESEERVRRVVEASGAGLWDLDAATGQIEADARMIDLMGFPPAAPRLGQLFEPLQRATEEIDFKTRSVGLGLYIVDAIVKAHGGTVGVVSTAEAGTTFEVRLPRDLHATPLP